MTVVVQVHMCLPYPLPSHRPACGCQESRFLTVPAPHACACLCTLSGPLFIQALGSPGGTGGSSSNSEGNNFIYQRATSCRSNAVGGERRNRSFCGYRPLDRLGRTRLLRTQAL